MTLKSVLSITGTTIMDTKNTTKCLPNSKCLSAFIKGRINTRGLDFDGKLKDIFSIV